MSAADLGFLLNEGRLRRPTASDTLRYPPRTSFVEAGSAGDGLPQLQPTPSVGRRSSNQRAHGGYDPPRAHRKPPVNASSADDLDSRPGVSTFRFRTGAEDAGRRLDLVLADRLRGFSRTALKKAVKAGKVVVDGIPVKPSRKISADEEVAGEIDDTPDATDLEPQEMAISVLFEDASILVLDKPAGLTVHPGAGQKDGTLANGLAFRFEALSDAGGPQRPGIVHRLDRDTSGVMVVAKTNSAHFALAAQFQARETGKEYRAVVEGDLSADAGTVSKPIGRSPTDPARMAADLIGGKPAETGWEVLERFGAFTYVRCRPKTGRTHQIRVHLKTLGTPIACDGLYGRRRELRRSDLGLARRGAADDVVLMSRQALHALRLTFTHPLLGRPAAFEAPLPADFASVLAALREKKAAAAAPRTGDAR
jgi:23S rRNA pseudouridine1911/1915/1917 synthase